MEILNKQIILKKENEVILKCAEDIELKDVNICLRLTDGSHSIGVIDCYLLLGFDNKSCWFSYPLNYNQTSQTIYGYTLTVSDEIKLKEIKLLSNINLRVNVSLNLNSIPMANEGLQRLLPYLLN